jgi:hypothetical protein
MGKSPRKRRLSPEQRRTLQLLAGSPEGVNAELLVDAHRLSRPTLGSLVRTGLAAARREVVVAGDRPVEVLRLRITAAGRRAIEE